MNEERHYLVLGFDKRQPMTDVVESIKASGLLWKDGNDFAFAGPARHVLESLRDDLRSALKEAQRRDR